MKEKFTTQTEALFNYNLRRIAAELDVQQSAIADAFEVSRPAINKYFAGNRFPAPANIDRLANFFNINISDFFKTPEELKSKSEISEVRTLGDISDVESLKKKTHKVENEGLTFGVYVSTTALSPTAQQGDLLVCSSSKGAQNASTVLAVVDGEVKLMKVYKSTGYYSLAPLDGLSENIMGARAEVLAVVKEIRHPL